MIGIRITSKRLGGKEILRDVEFEIEEGRITALTGPSGIGKTTLLRIVAGLDRDYEGEPPPDLRLGMMFQEPRLLPWLTALQNIAAVCDDGVDAAGMHLHRAGVGDAAELYPRQLSLGMARRVALARALAVEPQLLILDEPFASLDVATAVMMRDLVQRECRERHATVLLVTHDAADVRSLAHRTVRLAGRPATIVRDHQYLGSSASGIATSGS